MAKRKKITDNQANDVAAPDRRALAGDTPRQLDRERIASRAYELYVARGATDGQDLEDWLRAERELSEPKNPRK